MLNGTPLRPVGFNPLLGFLPILTYQMMVDLYEYWLFQSLTRVSAYSDICSRSSSGQLPGFQSLTRVSAYSD